MRRRIWVIGLALLATPLQAEEPTTLEAVKKQIAEQEKTRATLEKQASSLSKDLAGMREALVALAEKIQANERRLSDAEKEVAAIDEELRLREADLERRSKQLEDTISAMLRFSRVPPEAWVALPGSADDAVRSAMLLGHVTEGLREEAAQLREHIRLLGELRQERALLQQTLAEEQHQLRTAEEEMRAKLEERNKRHAELNRDLEKNQSQLKRLSAKSKDLSELLDALAEREAASSPRPAPGKTRDAARAGAGKASGLRLPVQGKIVSSFGDKDASGANSKGLKISTRAGAQVVAPSAGEVVYTGPFLSYGNIVIIRHTEELHSLLAGMEKIQVSPGQELLAGEPVGRMASSAPASAGSGHGLTKLYMELRKNAKPIDPSPWLKN